MNYLPEPHKKITYPIAHDDEGGCLYIYHNDHSSPPSSEIATTTTTKKRNRVVLCCPGFPDDHEAFVPLASRLANEQGQACVEMVGVMCLPGFDDRPEKPWSRHWKEGYTLDEMVAAFQQAAKALMKEATTALSTCDRQDIDYTVILHDWGVVVGMSQINRAVVEEEEAAGDSGQSGALLVPNQVVIMDVGLPFHPNDVGKPKLRSPIMPHKDDSLYRATTEALYRLLLLSMFFLQRYVSSVLAALTFAIGSQLTIATGLVPSKYIDNKLIRDRNPNPLRLAYMSYPYYTTAMALFSGKRKDIEQHATLPVLDKIPVLFLYGLEKNIQFHDDKLVGCLEGIEEAQTGRSRCVAVEKGGHWFHLQQPEVTYREIRKFLLHENEVETTE